MTTRFRMVVTGATGQVARSLVEVGPGLGVEVAALGRPAIDLARPDTLAAAIGGARPDILVNAAARSDPERCEFEPEVADAVNAQGAGAFAACAAQLGIPIIQLSTSYVFDGAQSSPYRESDAPCPIGAYGRSKLTGEQAVIAANPRHAILRMSWIFSAFGRNLVTAILKQGDHNDEVRVVADQTGNPTAAADAAAGVIAVARNLLQDSAGPDKYGLFHMASAEIVTPADFAAAIFAASACCGGPSARVAAIPGSAYSSRVRRPPNVALDCSKIAAVHGLTLPSWRPALRTCIARILEARP
jgi:dTDP-4-dehydrorhamnose reductase